MKDGSVICDHHAKRSPGVSHGGYHVCLFQCFFADISLCLPTLALTLSDMLLAVLGISTATNCVELRFEGQLLLFIFSRRAFWSD